MDVIIKETSTLKTLSLIHPKTKLNNVLDFIGNAGGLSEGQFEWSEEQCAYLCDQETFNWWEKVIHENEVLEERIFNLVCEHDQESVYDVVYAVPNSDLEDHATKINQALDDTAKKIYFDFCVEEMGCSKLAVLNCYESAIRRKSAKRR